MLVAIFGGAAAGAVMVTILDLIDGIRMYNCIDANMKDQQMSSSM